MASGFRWVGRKPTQETYTRKIGRLNAAARSELSGLGGRMIAVATRLSSGPYSTAQLRALGHPYSRRHPKLGLVGGRPEVINIQTGEYHASWQFKIHKRYGKTALRISNLAPHAKFLPPSRRYLGRSRMVPRPIFRAIMKETERDRRNAVRRAVRRGLSAR